ncbi:MAG: PA14 domain-containing protein, partial [bacterium]
MSCFQKARAKAALVCWLLLGVAWAAAATPWHQASSLFRAEFEITARPEQPEAGIMLNVPVCGLGAADGSDLFAFDAAGQPLALLPLGESSDNTALAVVRAPAVGDRLFLYFGSGIKSPHNKTFFKPGLTVDIRSCPDGALTSWDSVRALVDKSRRLARLRVDQVSLAGNPVTSSDAFIMVFEGWLRLTGSPTLMLVSDDAGYLLINNQLVISRNGTHGANDAVRGESRATLDFTSGQPRPFRVVVADTGGEQMAVLASWAREGRDKAMLPPAAFIQSGTGKLLAVSGRDAGPGCPAFRYNLVSY